MLAFMIDLQFAVVGAWEVAEAESEAEEKADRPGSVIADRHAVADLLRSGGPNGQHWQSHVRTALSGDQIAFGAELTNRRLTCNAVPLEGLTSSGPHALLIVHDHGSASPVEPATGAGNDRGDPPGPTTALDELDRKVLVALAAGRTQTTIASMLALTRRGLDYRVARLRARLGANSITLTGLVASAYARGILVPDVWPPRAQNSTT